MSDGAKIIQFPGKKAESTYNFRDFARAIASGDIPLATQVLQQLFLLSEGTCQLAAEHFHKQFTSDPDFMNKGMQLRMLVANGNNNDVLMGIGECFGVFGPDALAIAGQLKKILVD